MPVPQIPADSAFSQARPPRLRDTVAMEQLFFGGMLVAMLAVQMAGFVATYIFLAHSSGTEPPWKVSPAPVMVEISR